MNIRSNILIDIYNNSKRIAPISIYINYFFLIIMFLLHSGMCIFTTQRVWLPNQIFEIEMEALRPSLPQTIPSVYVNAVASFIKAIIDGKKAKICYIFFHGHH